MYLKRSRSTDLDNNVAANPNALQEKIHYNAKNTLLNILSMEIPQNVLCKSAPTHGL